MTSPTVDGTGMPGRGSVAWTRRRRAATAVWRQYWSSGQGRAGLIILILFFGVAIAAPLISPSSGLDVTSTRTMRDIIRQFAERGMTVFLTTHNIEEANLLCDRVAIIVKARIVAIDSPENLKMALDASRSVEIAFKKAPPSLQDWLKASEMVSAVRKEGDKWKVFTSNPSEFLDALVGYVGREKVNLLSVNTLGPSLEDVFVSLVTDEGKGGG